ncbi:MAG TPA: Gfo/Idh/MocA family oxidoreductase [Bacteroidia bacterium]
MSDIFKVVLIGAGNIGSRHAQALMKLERALDITVFDVSEASLSVCKVRIEEIARGNHKTAANYITDSGQLPGNADLAIVATSSGHRLVSLEKLLSATRCKCIILEKFLFPTKEEYKQAELLLQQQKDIRVYVNCVKRMFDAYQFVKKKLDAIDGKIKMSLKGNNWGLAGNAVHYIDLFAYLADEDQLTISLTETPFSEIVESKREGYIELLGECKVLSSRGDEASIVSAPGEYKEIECRIEKGGKEFLIIELGSTIEVIIDNEKTVFDYPFQSLLTKQYAEELLVKGKISLTEYKISADQHLKFLDAAEEFIRTKKYNKEWKIT